MEAPVSPEAHASSRLVPGAVIAGKFRLSHVVGRGGMGSVWAARHLALDMPVALKFIEAEGDPVEARVRFEREARAAAQIRSPHVVQILDHGIDGDLPYIAMELLEGEDLVGLLRREGRISVPRAARILTQACKALRRAHEGGIIHRDLKPGNVFLARFDDDEVVKLLDFGVAKMRRAGAIDEPLATRTGIIFGSPSYMSPEQARGARTIDHRSDLWSMAVIIYRAVTGVKPFQGASIADLVVALCIDPLPVATRAAPDLPPQIDAFFARAFAREPDQRFSSAPEMALAFEAVSVAAGGEPPAPPPSSSLPAVPWAVPAPASRTPPSGALAAPPSARLPALRAAGAPMEPTPASGTSQLPSGGWGIAPPLPPPSAAPPPPAPLAAPPGPPGLAPRPAWQHPVLVAGALGGALLSVLVLVLVARQGVGHEGGAPGPASAGEILSASSAPPVPPASVAEPAAASEAAASSSPPASEPLPAPSASAAEAAASASALPRELPPVDRRGPGKKTVKKKRPNFGY